MGVGNLDQVTQKVKALATLENEKEKKVEKKWKNSDVSSLTGFCGLNSEITLQNKITAFCWLNTNMVWNAGRKF
jgi:hypothetical protein